MGLSYTEEIVSEYYKHIKEYGKLKYFVSDHVYFKGKAHGWRDIDILAVGKKEILIIQTKSYAYCSSSKRNSVKMILKFFEEAEKFVRKSYEVNNKNVKKIFIADYGLSEQISQKLNMHKIETMKLTEIFTSFLKILDNDYMSKNRISKDENNVTRTLMFLISWYDKKLRSCGIL
jgi:hypothetical protein